MKDLPKYWQKFFDFSLRFPDGGDSRFDAENLLNGYRELGYLHQLPADMLATSNHQIALFYESLLDDSLQNGQIPSPVRGENSSQWMLERDFCFLNVRAVGPNPDKTGSFIDALKILPSLRADAIHLAPFFASVFGNVYALDSLAVIAPEIVDQAYLSFGLSGEEQLRLLIDAIHLLGKVAGFDLEPHTAQFSRVVLMYPQHFRWLELSADKESLAGGITQQEMLTPIEQDKIIFKVQGHVSKALSAAKLDSLEVDSSLAEEIHLSITNLLIANGIWTLPTHSWSGVGLPRFAGYNKEANYPLFEYLDHAGNDCSSDAFGMLTPIKLVQGLAINNVAVEDSSVSYYEPGIDFYASIFPRVQAEYGFDFIRFDYADHIFDSVDLSDEKLPISDRPTPYILEKVLNIARKESPAIGAMAERMGYDFDRYNSIGFDLVLGAEMLRTIDLSYVIDQLRFASLIENYNKSHERRASVQFAVDSHDTGHPDIAADDLLKNAQSMKLRLFMARFSHYGLGRRPKYEVVGNQEMTRGMYRANNEPVSIAWESDHSFFELYNNIENIYNKFRFAIANSYVREYHFYEDFAVWYLDRGDGYKMRLACICCPIKEGVQKELRNVKIYPFAEYGFDCARIDEINLDSNDMNYVPIEPDGYISLGKIEPGEVRLFWIRENETDLML